MFKHQRDEDLSLEKVKEKWTGCSPNLQSDMNCCSWFKWKDINSFSQALKYWKQLLVVVVLISSQAKVYYVFFFCFCILSESEFQQRQPLRILTNNLRFVMNISTWITVKYWNIYTSRNLFIIIRLANHFPYTWKWLGEYEYFSIFYRIW